MVILLDCRPFQYNTINGEVSHFIISCAHNLSRRQDVEWIFLVDRTYRAGSLPGLSGRQIVTRRAFPGKAGWKLWYDWQIERVAKKYKADLVMTTGGRAASGISFPQCLWIPESSGPDTGNLSKVKNQIRKLVTQKKRRGNNAGEAGAILTFTETDKTNLAGDQDDPDLNRKVGHRRDAGSIFVIPGAADEGFIPLSAEEKEVVKQNYSGGKEYFLSLNSGGGPEDRIEVLKSFSLFKKRQKSNMQLILAGSGLSTDGSPDNSRDKHFSKKLETYKYRADVHIYDHLPGEELSHLLGAAYTFIYPYNRDNLGISLLNSWKCEVPVITPSIGRVPETGGGAALYDHPGDPASLAGLMMTLYKDESRRNDLIEKGKTRLELFTWEHSVDRLWEAIRFAFQGYSKK